MPAAGAAGSTPRARARAPRSHLRAHSRDDDPPADARVGCVRHNCERVLAADVDYDAVQLPLACDRLALRAHPSVTAGDEHVQPECVQHSAQRSTREPHE